jgi:hypothetical protein
VFWNSKVGMFFSNPTFFIKKITNLLLLLALLLLLPQ